MKSINEQTAMLSAKVDVGYISESTAMLSAKVDTGTISGSDAASGKNPSQETESNTQPTCMCQGNVFNRCCGCADGCHGC